jgi:IMP dehydrogenase
MNTAELVLRLVAGLGLILANGFFVAIEFALTRVRQYSESEFDTSGLRRAWEMTDDLEIYLTSCQVGITASSIAVGIVAEPALAALFEPLIADTALASIGAGAIIAFVIINLLHLTHGEQTPTYLGVERTKFVCKYGAAPLYYFAYLISPLIKLGDAVAKWTLRLFGIEMTGAWLETEQDAIESRAELRNKLGNVLDEGELTDERQEEVMNALRVGETDVAEMMVDRDDIVALSTENSSTENLSIVEDHPHTRFPLVGDSVDDFRGIVYMPAVLNRFEELSAGEIDMEALAVEPLTIDAETSVSDAIDRFQEQSQELALVTRDGKVVGLLTATDAFESVMGELDDPLDRSVERQRRQEDGPVTDA